MRGHINASAAFMLWKNTLHAHLRIELKYRLNNNFNSMTAHILNIYIR